MVPYVRKSNGLGQWSSALEIKTGGPSRVKNATMISYDADICCKELKWSKMQFVKSMIIKFVVQLCL